MAIPFLNHLDVKGNISLNDNKLQDFVVDHSTQAAAGTTAGKLIYDSGSLKFYDGVNNTWQTLGTGTGSGSVTSVAISGTDGIQVDSGSPITTSGTITLGLNAIANDKLANSSVSYGGVSVSLGGSDATPAFDLADATNYPTSSLSGTISNSQLAGSIANAKLANSSVAYGGVTLSLGGSDATPAFDLSDATNYPTSSLSGTISNSQLAGSIANGKLANSSITIDGSAVSLGGSVTTLQLGTSDSTALAGNTTVDDVSVANFKSAAGSAMPSNTLAIGDSNTTTTIAGNLVVTGTTTTNNVETVSTSNGVVFEGSNADDHEVTLLAGTVTADRTATLPDATGTIVLADATQTLSNKTIAASQVTEISNLTAVEGAQLENINSVTISNAQWGYLGGATAFGGSLLDDANASAARTTLGVDAAGTDNSTDVTLVTTSHDYLSISGQAITLGAIDLAADVTGDLPVTEGGTGASNASSARTNLGLAYASSSEAKAGTASAKVLSPDLLAERSITATIDVSAMDSTVLKAVIDHDLDTHNVIVETSFTTSKEVVICEYHKDNNGSASTDHLTFHFASVPSEDILVTVTSAKGANTITPTYPTS
jgi:hypothetical protein